VRSPERLVSGAEFWDAPEVVAEYGSGVRDLRWYDRYLMAAAAESLGARAASVARLYAVGCGTGGELPALLARFPSASVLACDPAPAMVAACREHLAGWKLQHRVDLRCCPASALTPEAERPDLVVALDNVLTYITPLSERLATLHALRGVITQGGVLAGSVHHRWGRPGKTAYFLLRAAGSRLRVLRGDPGDRVIRQAGRSSLGHYFTAKELSRLLEATGFRPVLVRSLAQVAGATGQPYIARSGSNNLLFVAVAC
jgi:SAM-dependent methyltransferase